MSGPSPTAPLVVPALRWSETVGFGLADPALDRWLGRGVRGFLLFGGAAAAVAEATAELTVRAGRALLIGADLERGAGQQFEGCTPLPPALALGTLGPEVVREAARLTATEAAALGVRWLFAPVADVAVEPDNPIVATRALGRDPASAATAVRAWVAGAHAGGGIPCLKHFPGHGRTVEDSHATLPVVDAPAAVLEAELEPFRAGIAAGAPSVMTAHVAYPALDPSGRAATRSSAILRDRLRTAMGFGGVIASDALIMAGIGPAPEAAAVESVAAGVDALLYPPDPDAMIAALDEALEAGRLARVDVDAAVHRLEALVRADGAVGAAGAGSPTARAGGTHAEGGARPWGRAEDRARARGWAAAVLRVPPGWPRPGGGIALEVVDDDEGGPYPAASREPLLRGARALLDDAPDAPLVVGVFADPRGWKGRAGLSSDARRRVETLVQRAREGGRACGIVLFGDPVRRRDLPGGVPVLEAWGGEAIMQEAVAAALAGRDRS